MNENLYETRTLIRKSCSRLGAALAVFIFANVIPEFIYNYTSLGGTLGKGGCMLLFYAIIFPILILIFRTVPSAPPEKQSMGIVNWAVWLIIAQGMGTMANFVSQYINTRISGVTGVSSMDMNPVTSMLTGMDMLTMLYIAILGPLCEEIIFRAFLINRLRCYGEDVAIVYSAICFGFMHGNIAQMLYAIIIGMVMGYVYVKTGKLRYTLLMHIWINGGSLLLTLFALDGSDAGLGVIVLSVMWMFLEIPLALVFFAIMRDKIVIIRYGRPDSESLRELMPAMFVNVGTIAFLLLCTVEIIQMCLEGTGV